MSNVLEPGSAPELRQPPPSDQEDVLGRRISAALIDLAVLVGVFIVVAQAIGDTTVEGGTVSLSLSGVAAGVYLGLVFMYHFVLESAVGQTLGKLVLGLRVVDAEGGRPSPAAVGVRTVLRVVDWLPFLYLVGFITMMATGRSRRRLGDLAAKTTVERAAHQARRSLAFVPMAALVFLIAGVSVYKGADPSNGATVETLRLTVEPAELVPTDATLFLDRFSDSGSGWLVRRDRAQSNEYVNGGYRITVRDTSGYLTVHSNHLDRAAPAISVAAVLRQAAGHDSDEFGVLCVSNLAAVSAGSSNVLQSYASGIEPDKGFLWLRKMSGAEVVATFGGGESAAIKPRGGVNRIRADCVGTRASGAARLTAYVNGKLIGDEIVPGGDKRFDGVGVYVWSDRGGTTVVFDDVIVREMKENG